MAISEDAQDYLDRVTPEIKAAIHALKLKYDTRALVACFAIESAQMYGDLKSVGIETELSVARIYRYLQKIAQEPPERAPRVLTEVPADEPTGKLN